ncbi:hypothetical protein ACMBCN_02830 [Candidatus Liberibacter asiaticus]
MKLFFFTAAMLQQSLLFSPYFFYQNSIQVIMSDLQNKSYHF